MTRTMIFESQDSAYMSSDPSIDLLRFINPTAIENGPAIIEESHSHSVRPNASAPDGHLSPIVLDRHEVESNLPHSQESRFRSP